jgi:squalene synthase HpnC
MTINHYENFPVASWLIPAHLRPAVRTIYAFARSADDIADEGEASDEQRLADLQDYENQLQLIADGGRSEQALFQDLADVIRVHHLPIAAFFDLLSAFKQDIRTKRYADFSDLLDYCQRSANPVGRIMLALFREDTLANITYSDQICSALQLINFWQDVAIDWKKQRVYIPQEDLSRFGISEGNIANDIYNINSDAWQALMKFQVHRARHMMLEGSPLCRRIPGRFGFELRLVVQGGLRILEKIEQVHCDVFRQRPRISKLDAPILMWRALKM